MEEQNNGDTWRFDTRALVVIITLVSFFLRASQPDSGTHFALTADFFYLPNVDPVYRWACLFILVACAFGDYIDSIGHVFGRILTRFSFIGNALEAFSMLLDEVEARFPPSKLVLPRLRNATVHSYFQFLLVGLTLFKFARIPDYVNSNDFAIFAGGLIIVCLILFVISQSHESRKFVKEGLSALVKKITQKGSKIQGCLEMFISVFIEPEQLLALTYSILFPTLFELQPFFSELPYPPLSLEGIIFYLHSLPFAILIPVYSTVAQQLQLFRNEQRFLLFAGFAFTTGINRVAPMLYALTGITYPSCWRLLLWYYPWPCLLIGIVGLYIPLMFVPLNGVSALSVVHDTFTDDPNHWNKSRVLSIIWNVAIQTATYALASLWSTEASLKVAQTAAARLQHIGYTEEYHGFWLDEALFLLLVLFILIVGLFAAMTLGRCFNLTYLADLDWSNSPPPVIVTKFEEVWLLYSV